MYKIAMEGDKEMKREGTVYWEREGGSGLERMGVGCLGVKGARYARFLPRSQTFLTTALAVASVFSCEILCW